MPTERLPVIYIAGPYRAKTPWGILQNIRFAQQHALEIWRIGGVALCPHANTAMFDGEAEDDVWLKGDLELLRRCDAIFMLKGWQGSIGAGAEKIAAEQLGLPVFYGFFETEEWIDGWKKSRRTEVERPTPSRDIESDFD